MGPYEAVIGLEVHCQLQTRSKAFSPDSASFGALPNRHVDPVSLGHPGTLPVLNRRVVEFAVRLGLATNCRIAERSVMARKHYFYPDLPKGYQLSQYENPICTAGYVDIGRPIRLTRIHIEEDAGKSLHDQDPEATLLDLNRCGVPLLEIVTEPDLRSAQEASALMQKMRQLVRYLGVSDGNMEEGSLRCDANVSIRKAGSTTLGAKTEIKNMNSFRHVERAIDHEVGRQVSIVQGGGTIEEQTLLWDPDRKETRLMRSKEQAHDYRYFPDPDLPPVVVTREMRAAIAAALPELPDARSRRYVEVLGLPEYDARVLTEERSVADYFEAALGALEANSEAADTSACAKAVSNLIMGDVMRELKASPEAGFAVSAQRLAGLVHLRMEGDISSTGAQELFLLLKSHDGAAEDVAARHRLLQISDDQALLPAVRQVLADHPTQVQLYLAGKRSIIGFFIGQVMRQFDGSPDPMRVRALLVRVLDARMP